MTGKKPPLTPEVEELSDLQWARIERGLWTKLDAAEAPVATPERERSGSWRTRGLVAGGALAAAAAALVLLLGRSPHAPVEVAEAPSRVLTRDSATTVSFSDAAIEVAPNSAVLLSSGADRSATVVLEGGRASFRVPPRQRPFLVVAGHATVRVVGTQFSVARSGEEIAVEVHEGKVAVQYLGQVHPVIAGTRWSSAEVTPVKTALIDAPASPATPAVRTDDERPAAPTAQPDDERPAAPTARPKREPAPPRVAPTAPAPVEPAPAEPLEPAPAEPLEPATPSDADARAAFAAAAKLESAAPKESLRRYLELAKRSDRWGANALFASARLAFDIGERGQAAALCRAYLKRFPKGANAADARALLDAIP
jgi:hypothetical protein